MIDKLEHPELRALRHLPNWDEAVSRLQTLVNSPAGAQARLQAKDYGEKFKQRRGLMVFDAVLSVQRRYSGVWRTGQAWLERYPAGSLADLVQTEEWSSSVSIPQRSTMQTIAKNLLAFGHAEGLDDDEEVCVGWALASGPLEGAPAHFWICFRGTRPGW